MEDEAVLKAINEANRRRACVPEASPVDISILAKWQAQMSSERHLSLLSMKAYGTDARQFAEFMAGREGNLCSARVADVEAFISHLRETKRVDRSIARKLTSLDRLYEWMLDENLIYRNPTAFSRVRKNWTNQPLSLTEAEVKQMLDEASCPAKHIHPPGIESRDSAILELLYGCGIRASELAGLDLDNIFLDEDQIYVRGKGNKERCVPLTKTAKDALKKYLRHRELDFPRPSESSKNAVFLSHRGVRLTRQWIWRTVKNTNPDAFPHRLRHSCASHMVDHGAKLKKVQKLLGHKFISTTGVYTQPVSAERLEETIRQCHSRARFKTNPNLKGRAAAKGGQDE